MGRFDIGCHLSSSGGFMRMIKDMDYVTGTTFQYFSRNPRGGSIKPVDLKDIEEFLKVKAERDMGPVLCHAPYTLNPCAKDEKIREFARMVFKEDLERMELIPGNLYNFHPGSHVGQGPEKGIELITEILNEVMPEVKNTYVLLETMAGKGTEVGRTFEEIRSIIDGVHNNERMGVCLDTCHIHDGGYDVTGDLDGVLDEFDRVIGLSRLKAIHMNDSKNDRGAHKDRHEKIGEGHIGSDALIRVINNERLKDIPIFLETPNELDGYRDEIVFLREHRTI